MVDDGHVAAKEGQLAGCGVVPPGGTADAATGSGASCSAFVQISFSVVDVDRALRRPSGDPRSGRQHQLVCVTRSMSRLCDDGCESDWTVLMCLLSVCLSVCLPVCLCACVRVWSLRRTPAPGARASCKQGLPPNLTVVLFRRSRGMFLSEKSMAARALDVCSSVVHSPSGTRCLDFGRRASWRNVQCLTSSHFGLALLVRELGSVAGVPSSDRVYIWAIAALG